MAGVEVELAFAGAELELAEEALDEEACGRFGSPGLLSLLDELADDDEADDDDKLADEPLSSGVSSSAYCRAHLESRITSCRLPLTLTASTVLGIDQSDAWF